MPCSHNCYRGQSAVNGQNGFLAAGQWSKYPKTVALMVKLASFLDVYPALCGLRASAINTTLLPCLLAG